MKTKFVSLLITIGCFVFAGGILTEIKAQEYSHRNVEVKTITLFSQIKHKDFAKANFNFNLGVRGDSASPRTYNNHDLRYGGNSLDGKSDWFDISTSRNSYSQIIDMGALKWADIYDIPFLPARSEAHNGMLSLDYAKGKDNIKITPENALVKVVEGHMYLIRVKENNYAQEINKDFYALFRVES